MYSARLAWCYGRTWRQNRRHRLSWSRFARHSFWSKGRFGFSGLAFLSDDGQDGSDRDLFSRLDEDFFDDAAGEDFYFNVRLVRLDIGDDVASANALSDILTPAQKLACAHVCTELRHDEFSHGERSSP